MTNGNETNLDKELDEILGNVTGDSSDDNTPGGLPSAESEEVQSLEEEKSEERSADTESSEGDTEVGEEEKAGTETGEEKTPEVAKETGVGSTEIEVMRKQIETLRLQLEQASEARLNVPATPKAEETSKAVEEALNDFGIKTEEDLDKVLESPQNFVALLNSVAKHSLQNAHEHLLRSIPSVVRQNIRQQRDIDKVVDTFYNENKDLAQFKRTVGLAMNEVLADHPDYNLQQALDAAAGKARTALGLMAKVKGEGEKTPPALPTRGGRGGRPSGGKQLNSVQKQILDLVSEG